MQRVLSSHSKLFSIPGETGLFSLQNIFARRHFGLSQDDLNSLYQSSSDIVDFFSKSVLKISTENANARFVEKTPQHVLHLKFIKKHFPYAKVINIVRDGRDCYCSSLSHPHIPQNKSVRKFARYWKKCIQAARLEGNSERVHTLRYEAFCENPASALGEVMNFLGLEAESSQLEVNMIRNDPRASSPQFQRLNESITNSSTGRWRADLSEIAAREFEQIASNELQLHGYELLN
jgi:hypothetical protein